MIASWDSPVDAVEDFSPNHYSEGSISLVNRNRARCKRELLHEFRIATTSSFACSVRVERSGLRHHEQVLRRIT